MGYEAIWFSTVGRSSAGRASHPRYAPQKIWSSTVGRTSGGRESHLRDVPHVCVKLFFPKLCILNQISIDKILESILGTQGRELVGLR